MLRRSRSIAGCTTITLTYAIEASGCRRLRGGSWCLCFFSSACFWCWSAGCGMLVVGLRVYSTRTYSMYVFVDFCWHKRHLKIFYICLELITKIVKFVTTNIVYLMAVCLFYWWAQKSNYHSFGVQFLLPDWTMSHMIF